MRTNESFNLFDLDTLFRQRDHDRVGVGAQPPLVGRHRRNVTLSVGVEVFLEKFGLSGDHEGDDLTEPVVGEAVKSETEKQNQGWKRKRFDLSIAMRLYHM